MEKLFKRYLNMHKMFIRTKTTYLHVIAIERQKTVKEVGIICGERCRTIEELDREKNALIERGNHGK